MGKNKKKNQNKQQTYQPETIDKAEENPEKL